MLELEVEMDYLSLVVLAEQRPNVWVEDKDHDCWHARCLLSFLDEDEKPERKSARMELLDHATQVGEPTRPVLHLHGRNVLKPF